MNVPADVRAKVLDKVRQIEQDIRNKMPELKDKLNIDYNKVRQENLIKMQTRLKEKELKDIESGKPKVSPPYSEPRAWTQMVGEEDRNFKPLPSPPAFIPNPPGIQEPRAWTQMIGEYDGRLPPHTKPIPTPPVRHPLPPVGHLVTMKIGEYDGLLPPKPIPQPQVTTMAIGEEDGQNVSPHPKSYLDGPYNQEWNKPPARRSFRPPQ